MICREQHEDGNHHIHMLVRFSEKQQFYDPTCFDFITGTHGNIQKERYSKRAVNYLKKSDESPIMWGDIDDETTWSDIANAPTKKVVLDVLKEKRPRDYCNSASRIVDNWEFGRAHTEPREVENPFAPKEPTIQVMWLYGSTGTGKDTRVKWIAHTFKETLFIKQAGTGQWWDGYRGEVSILLTDMRPKDMPLNHFLQLTDPYREIEMRVQKKGGHVLLRANTIYITTPKHPKLFYKTSHDLNIWAQVKRRITRIYECYSVDHSLGEDQDPFSYGCEDKTDWEPELEPDRSASPTRTGPMGETRIRTF